MVEEAFKPVGMADPFNDSFSGKHDLFYSVLYDE